MKPLLKYCLFLILFCSYGGVSLELNEKESKNNYSKETHDSTLTSKQSAHSSSIDIRKIIDIKDLHAFNAFAHYLFNQSKQDRYNITLKFYTPPKLNKIYLYNSLFLI